MPITQHQFDLIVRCIKYLKLNCDEEIKRQLMELDITTASNLISAFKANNNSIAINQLHHLKIIV